MDYSRCGIWIRCELFYPVTAPPPFSTCLGFPSTSVFASPFIFGSAGSGNEFQRFGRRSPGGGRSVRFWKVIARPRSRRSLAAVERQRQARRRLARTMGAGSAWRPYRLPDTSPVRTISPSCTRICPTTPPVGCCTFFTLDATTRLPGATTAPANSMLAAQPPTPPTRRRAAIRLSTTCRRIERRMSQLSLLTVRPSRSLRGVHSAPIC